MLVLHLPAVADVSLSECAAADHRRGNRPAADRWSPAAGGGGLLHRDRHEGRRPRRHRRRPARPAAPRDRARSARSAPSRRPPRRAGHAQRKPGALRRAGLQPARHAVPPARDDEAGGYRFLFVSEGCQKLFGFKQQHLLASADKLFDAFDAERRKGLETALRDSAAAAARCSTGKAAPAVAPGRSGSTCARLPHRFDNGVVEWRGIATNITESKESEAELRGSRQQLAELSSHLEAAKEEERERISRDIHDELGSILVFLKIEAAQLAAKLPADATRLREKARSIETLLGQAMSTASRVARELRPGILKEFGLPAAIECQAEDFSQRFGIPCRVQCDEDGIEPEPDTSLALFRIAQEALTNVAKHAHASLVVMRLRRESGNILLEIRDNGRGISELDMQKPRSFGLRGIRERVSSLGGEFAIGAAEHGGTHLVLRVPESRPAEPPTEEEMQRKLF
jgi:two-component system sensor histidine kinase UhpB